MLDEYRLIPEPYRSFIIVPDYKSIRHMLARNDFPVGGGMSIKSVMTSGIPAISTAEEISVARDAFAKQGNAYAGTIQLILRTAWH